MNPPRNPDGTFQAALVKGGQGRESLYPSDVDKRDNKAVRLGLGLVISGLVLLALLWELAMKTHR
jgi:hypothetical protein